MEKVLCQGVKANGEKCTYKAVIGIHCKIHAKKGDAMDVVKDKIFCQGTKANGEKCVNKASVGKYCKVHDRVEAKNKELGDIQPCITITYGDVVENRAGMEKVGVAKEEGFNLEDLTKAKTYFDGLGCTTELHHLNDMLNNWAKPPNVEVEDAYLLVIRKGVDGILRGMSKTADDMFTEHAGLTWDTKHRDKYGKEKNSIARQNLCYTAKSQVADIPQGKGTLIAFKDVPCLDYIRVMLHINLGDKAKDLVAEGNMYKNPAVCGIGGHGDKERKIVIAVRLGAGMPLQYHWFYQKVQIGQCFKVDLNHGNIYIMSSKAVGNDALRYVVPTLKHAAGGQQHLFE